MRTHHKVFHLLVLLILSCCENEPDVTPVVKINGNSISCNFCSEFGDIIEVEGNDIMISKYNEVSVYQYINGAINLKQTFSYGQTSGIQEITVLKDEMAIGVAGYSGTGTVYIYKKKLEEWSLIQEIKIGRMGDNFGNTIDFNHQWMIVGADAKWTNLAEGRAYIYRKEGSVWVQRDELLPSFSVIEGFGRAVALHDKYIFIGAGLAHQYQLVKEDWIFFKKDTLKMKKITHENNLFISYDATGGEGIVSWLLNDDGSKTFINIDTEFENMRVSDHGEIIELVGNFALVDIERDGACFLIELINNKWVNKLKLIPEENQSNSFYGMAIGDGFVVVGGINNLSNTNGTDRFVVNVWPL